MSGIELVECLDERYLHYPIIFITLRKSSDIPRVVTHPDIRDVLEKPLADDTLLDCIHAAVGGLYTDRVQRELGSRVLASCSRSVSQQPGVKEGFIMPSAKPRRCAGSRSFDEAHINIAE
jgi:FixJ family two-component response regulator